MRASQKVVVEMFGISGFEFFLIVAFALLIFGPEKLPQIGRTIGRFMNEFKRVQANMEEQIRAEMYRSDIKEKLEQTLTPATATASQATDEDEEEDEE